MKQHQEDKEVENREEEHTQARKLAKALLKEIDFVPSEVKKLVHEDMFIDDEEDYETGAHSDTSAETLTHPTRPPRGRSSRRINGILRATRC